MKKQINPNIQAYLLRAAFYALMLVAMCAIPFALAERNVTKPGAATELSQRTLSFEERIAYQRAIEEVYWRHRIWPKERPDTKPALDAVMSQAQIEKKVEDYLRDSEMLEDYWQRPISAEQLQAEMDRMAEHTKRPEVLRELFEALDNDPFVIAECLARPTLSERSESNFYAYDQRPDGEVRGRAEANVLAEQQMPKLGAAASASYTLPTIPDRLSGCIDNWIATSTTNAPSARNPYTAVWTGSEMIVWGGNDGSDSNTGGKYNPATDSWTATNTSNAPSARAGHTAVWTGTEMIIWGGGGLDGHYLNTGGKYNPATDSWTATSTSNAPSARAGHTAVWTGTEMIIWGGSFLLHGLPPVVTYLNTGARYDPSIDSWTATGTSGAPKARGRHTAVWTGSEMTVWGGFDGSHVVNSGGRYDSTTDSWSATSTTNAPSARDYHTGVWTDSEMIVWGGSDGSNVMNTGGRYDPGTDSWAATSTTNAPAAREFHTAVWSGNEMIVWGGSDESNNRFNSGGSYCAQSGVTPTPTPGAPGASTNPATKIASFSATLNGTVNPNGFTTNVHFQYGTTTSYGSTTSNQSYSGNTRRAVSANISGLAANTTYHFRIVATNSHGTRYGRDRTFTTLSPTGPPVAITNPASYVASFSARLNGSVDSHGLTTTVYFQYGTTTSYGLTTAIQSKTGDTYQSVVATIGGLTASTTYHFRVVATNGAGTRYGSDRTFTTLSATGSPVAIKKPATNVASSSATLNGSVDPHGLTTTVYFQYGTTTNYGHTTANQSKTGNTYQNVSPNITGLNASTTYHFRVVATNSAGTRYGSDTSFTTP